MSRFGLADDRDGSTSRPGGDWAGLRPTMDNPMTWSLPILRIGGVTVRLHLLFLAFIVVQLAWAIVPSQQSPVDFKLTAMALGVLLVVVLAHEFGHVLMCRLAEGEADEILMWPLGGLAMCHPPRTPRAHFWTALGGPLVNLAIIALAAPILMLLTRDWRVVLPDPLNPLDFARDPLIARSLPTLLLYMVNALSVMVLAFNLLPLFPLDGGRILHAMLWKRKGWSGGMRIAVRVGFVVGLALAAYGAIA
jgi:Zn-dependent protease